MTPAQFLAIFPEFASVNTAIITFWLSVAANLINVARWGSLASQGQALLTAHYLVLASANASAQTAGTPLGQVKGVLTAKAVDGVSVSMDSAAVTITGAGMYNATTYGVQWIQLARMMGAGGMQVNAQ
ncbi:MAG: DUF4054 domain-containing protein [Syntrophomonadaceae bacterium]|nr:DUF4054 domain-containing protein [Syntrophomonadaceae bacterium]